MPKVSILVPCCNVEKYVEECLISIKNQTLRDIEVICINDGSTDSTLDLINRCTVGDDRFIVINKPNSGYGDSMNLGLGLAKGEYIGIVESDDFIEPNMFELLYENAKKFDLDVSRACYFHLRNGKDEINPCPLLPKNQVYEPKTITSVFFQVPSIWAAIYKTEWLRQWGINFLATPGASYQDTSFAFKVNLMAKRCMVIEDCLLHYRLHGENSVKSKGKVFTICNEYAECIRFAKEHKLSDIAGNIIPAMQYKTYKWNYFRLDPELAHEFFMHWVKEWRALRDSGFTPKSWTFSQQLKFKLITEYPSLFEWDLRRKRKN